MCYDANGKRVSKRLTYEDPAENEVTTYYIYNGNNLLYEKEDNGGTISYRHYLYNNQGVIGYVIGNTVYTYRKNLFGDITAIYQGATKVAEYAYDAWGNCTIVSDTWNIGASNPFRYRGYYWDDDLKLYYLMSRYYDPQTGRFINADTLDYLDPESINGLNLYAYCGNNPAMYIDPTGHISLLAILGIIFAVAATINDIYQMARDDGEGVEVSHSNDTVKVKNSYKIITPWMRHGYAFYLNHINKDTKDIIQGSSAGVQFEWELHNYAAWLGIGGDAAKDLDIGKSIFTDGKHHPLLDQDGKISEVGVMSLGMRILYILSVNPIYWIWDLIANGGF